MKNNAPTDRWSSLDWPALVEVLSECARTPMGSRAARDMGPLPDADAVRDAWDLIDDIVEFEREGDLLPVGAVSDITDLVTGAQRGRALETVELRAISTSLAALIDLARVVEQGAPCVVLAQHTTHITFNTDVSDLLATAFEPDGSLSTRAFPELAELKSTVDSAHRAIRQTLDELVKGPSLTDVLQDQYVTQRSNRYVLPIKAHAKRWDIGIVHDTSGSGHTVFIEPHEVIAHNNRLRLATAALEAEERRIRTHLSHCVGTIAESVFTALDITTTLDLACARAELARRMEAIRPTVGNEGVIHLRAARHPVLSLRGSGVVPNDLEVTPAHPVLILTGPNTGGKTIALKTIGLCALLVTHGCFVPAGAGSRVDYFHPVVPLVGDLQTVHDDQSSFSGHIAALATMLEAARPGALLLIDEITQGTDPAQGAALAQALIEALLDQGPRVVITTHFARLKGLGASDPRIALAALEYTDGQPTYRVIPGLSGASRAFAVAEQRGLGSNIVARARELLDAPERSMADVLSALEQERTRTRDAEERAVQTAKDLEETRTALAAREDELARRIQELHDDSTDEFRRRLSEAERAIGAVVADLQRTPDPRKVEAARATVTALRSLTPAPPPSTSPTSPSTFGVGDQVTIARLGKRGEIVAVGDRYLQVRVGTATVRAGPADVTRLTDPVPPPSPRPSPVYRQRTTHLQHAVRVESNTLDMRGLRVDEGIVRADRFLDQSLLTGQDVVFFLHGHGTGALKTALRQWLTDCTSVRQWSPAAPDQGGDAFTAVALSD